MILIGIYKLGVPASDMLPAKLSEPQTMSFYILRRLSEAAFDLTQEI
jgi:hypothetical protein